MEEVEVIPVVNNQMVVLGVPTQDLLVPSKAVLIHGLTPMSKIPTTTLIQGAIEVPET